MCLSTFERSVKTKLHFWGLNDALSQCLNSRKPGWVSSHAIYSFNLFMENYPESLSKSYRWPFLVECQFFQFTVHIEVGDK